MKIKVTKESLIKRCQEVIENVSREQAKETRNNKINFLINELSYRKYFLFGPKITPTKEQLADDKWVDEQCKKEIDKMIKWGCRVGEIPQLNDYIGGKYKELAESLLNAASIHIEDTIEINREEAEIFQVWPE